MNSRFSHDHDADAAGGSLVYVPVPIRSELPVAHDPVCGAAVAIEHMAGELIHEGETYRFCSLSCAGRFAAEPERYALDTPAA